MRDDRYEDTKPSYRRGDSIEFVTDGVAGRVIRVREDGKLLVDVQQLRQCYWVHPSAVRRCTKPSDQFAGVHL